eukprot:1688142-Rhodomonas_salina.1
MHCKTSRLSSVGTDCTDKTVASLCVIRQSSIAYLATRLCALRRPEDCLGQPPVLQAEADQLPANTTPQNTRQRTRHTRTQTHTTMSDTHTISSLKPVGTSLFLERQHRKVRQRTLMRYLLAAAAISLEGDARPSNLWACAAL